MAFFEFLLPGLLGGGLGALTNRKDPLKGALIGGGLGAAGAGIGGLLGGGAGGSAAGSIPGSTAQAFPYVGETLGPAVPIAEPTGGLLAQVQRLGQGAQQLDRNLRPVANIAGTAGTIRSLFQPQPQQAPQPPPIAEVGGGSGLGGLNQAVEAGGLDRQRAQQMQDEMRRRRMALLTQIGLGGGYG